VSAVAAVNGVAIASAPLPEAELRQRACSELLRQAARREGLLPQDDPDPVDGILSEAASEAVERLLERALRVPEPSEDECRRYHAAHQARYSTGERVRARHILFAVTPGVDVVALRKRAEAALLDVRTAARGDEAFARSAAELSNCPSGAEGGALGWLSPGDCAPEFARELFGKAEVGVLPRLVHSRFGLHVVEVLDRDPGLPQPYEAVREAVRLAMQRQATARALSQYLKQLARDAVLEGVALEASDSPLAQ
jgi:peptidyl-prolyl cis-trans isomerase C